MAGHSGQERLLPPSGALSNDVALFLSDCQMRNLAPKTLRAYSYQLDAFLDWLHDNPTAEITTQHLRAYFLALRVRVGASTQHQAFRTLRTFFRFLLAEGAIGDNPMARLRPPKLEEQVLEPVPVDTVRAMLETCGGRGLLDFAIGP